MEENKYLKYAKVIDEICNAYENETDNEFKDCEFQMAYDKAFRSLHYSKWDEFKEACYQNERFRKYYKISYGEKKFNERFVKVFESNKQTKIKSNDKEQEMNLEDTDEFDFDDSKWNDDEDNDETNDDDQIKICPSCKTQMGLKVFICPKCGLRCGSGTIRNKTDLEIDKKIDEFKKQFQEKINKDYNGINLDWDWDINLLIDKISESIRKHSSSDLKQYLRDYTEKPMCKNIKSEYDKAMNICCCSDVILKILKGLKVVFKDDELALEHIDKCYRSIDQLLYEKTKLAEKLKPEENEDELSFNDDKDSDNDDFNFVDDDNDYDEFNFDDDDDEKSSKKNDDDWPWDDDEFDFDDDEDDRSANKEEQIAAATTYIIKGFYNHEAFSSIDIPKLVYGTVNALKNDDIETIDDCLANILHNIKPSKDYDTLTDSVEYSKVFYIVLFTCEEIGKILNVKKINNFLNGTLRQYRQLWEGNNLIVNQAFKDFQKRYKTKQNWKKAGNILGTILLSPLIAASKLAEWSDEYSERPDVQERRRIESIRYYCKFCGQDFQKWGGGSNIACPNRIRYDKAKAHLEGTTPPTFHGHMKYEGSQKSEYECKNCGKTYKTIWSMVNDVCLVKVRYNKDKYNRNNKPGLESDILTISRHEPAL